LRPTSRQPNAKDFQPLLGAGRPAAFDTAVPDTVVTHTRSVGFGCVLGLSKTHDRFLFCTAFVAHPFNHITHGLITLNPNGY